MANENSPFERFSPKSGKVGEKSMKLPWIRRAEFQGKTRFKVLVAGSPRSSQASSHYRYAVHNDE